MIKICPVCNRQFKDDRAKVYCSPRCRRASINERRAASYQHKKNGDTEISVCTKVCPVCNKEFATSSKLQVYCSAECRTKKPDKKKTIGFCRHCGQEFIKNLPKQVFCSTVCYDAWRKIHRQNARTKFTHICKFCGKVFTNYTEGSEYCTQKCLKADEQRKSKKNSKSLEEYCLEAAMCGLSYGKYRAALSMGKTFEELRRH